MTGTTELHSGDHRVRVTPMTLADGRELIYFDDDPAVLDGTVERVLTDPRDLPRADTRSEMRRDPLTGEWVAYASHRMNRTFMPPANENPLAPTREGQAPSEIPSPDYDVVVFENRFPSFSLHMEATEGDSDPVDGEDIFPRRPARSRCEVICFTPDASRSFADLPLSRIRTVIEAWAHRTAALSALPEVRHVFPFENRGEEIGVTLQHPHGQIYSYPVVPPRIRRIVESSRRYRAEHGGALFEDVLAAERRAGTRVVHAGEAFTVVVPAAAKWPLEVMVLPHRAVRDLAGLTVEEREELARILSRLYPAVDRFFDGVDRTPYIAAWNQAPADGPERDEVRLHLQLFSLMRSPHRMKFLAGSESAMGFWINDTTPERIADRLREVW